MRNFLRNSVAALGVFLSVLAATAPAFALTNPATFAPRMFQTQQTHYIRFSVNSNSCVYVSLACTVKVGNLPYNAFVLRIYSQTTTTWNAGTSASVGLGVNSPATNLMASAAVTTAGNAAAQTVAVGGLGESVTGNGAAQTGQDGGFDLNATITIVGALPTAGSTQFVVEYIAPNDGSCTNGASAGAC
jgi:hypothetical protein